MKLSLFYPNLSLNFNVKFICTKPEEIKKNCIYVNLQNVTNFDISDKIKNKILVVNETPLFDNSILSITVPNAYQELIRLLKIYYDLLNVNYKLIGILNDDFLNYKKMTSDLFKSFNKEKIDFIEQYDNIENLFKTINNFGKNKVDYIFLFFHSNELNQLNGLLYFDYIILPKSNYNNNNKNIYNINHYLQEDGLLIYNYDDFSDLSIIDNSISFSCYNDGMYNINDLTYHSKIITGSIYKNKKELTEFLFCFNNQEYIYYVFSLFILFDNIYQSSDRVQNFFSKYIL